jgi:hypothetical protein
MTSDPTTVSESTQELESSSSCAACSHSLDFHDAIGIRFCAATTDQHLERNCICKGEQAAGPYYVRYL